MSSRYPTSTEPEEHGIYYLGKVGQRTQITRAHEPPPPPPILPPPSILAGQRPQLPPLPNLQPPAGPQYSQAPSQFTTLPERPHSSYIQPAPHSQSLPPLETGARWQPPPPPPQARGGPVSSFPRPALYPQKASFMSKNPGTVYEALSPVEYSTHEPGGRPSYFDERTYSQSTYPPAPVSTFQSPTGSYHSSTTSSSGAASGRGSVQYPQYQPPMVPASSEQPALVPNTM
ncbi:MAG: hypothetical protein Q9164_006209 [Protoblastenia rupestris]